MIEGRCCEVLVNWMNFKLLERIDRSDGMLPYIAYYIIEIACFKHIDWAG
jgi:hypothetical protein